MATLEKDAAPTPSSAARWSLLLLFFAGLINFFDRASLGVAATSIRTDLHLSATQVGLLLSAFSLAYGIAQLPLAALLRPGNARRILGFGLLLWSFAQAGSGLVSSFRTFLVLRVALGAGESPYYPAGVQMVHAATAPQQRGRATALLNLASQAGLATAPPLLTLLLLRYGWRGMFLTLGIAGGLLSTLWFIPHQPALHDVPGSGNAQHGPVLASLLKEPTMWGMMLGFGGLNYVNWFFISWLPGYFETGRGISLRTSGWLVAAPFLAGACGALSSGALTDALGHRHVSDPAGHRERLLRTNLIVGLLCCGASTAFVSHAESIAAAVALVCAAMFCLQYAGTSGWGLVQAMAPAHAVPAASALQNFGSFMLASLAPFVTGVLLDRTHSFGIALAVCGAMAALGAASYATLTHTPFRDNAIPGRPV